MHTHADKTQEDKNISAAGSFSAKGIDSKFQFVDNRPEAIVQEKLREIGNKSSKAKKTAQLQTMINTSPRTSAQRQQLERMFGRTTQNHVKVIQRLKFEFDSYTLDTDNLEEFALWCKGMSNINFNRFFALRNFLIANKLNLNRIILAQMLAITDQYIDNPSGNKGGKYYEQFKKMNMDVGMLAENYEMLDIYDAIESYEGMRQQEARNRFAAFMILPENAEFLIEILKSLSKDQRSKELGNFDSELSNLLGVEQIISNQDYSTIIETPESLKEILNLGLNALSTAKSFASIPSIISEIFAHDKSYIISANAVNELLSFEEEPSSKEPIKEFLARSTNTDPYGVNNQSGTNKEHMLKGKGVYKSDSKQFQSMSQTIIGELMMACKSFEVETLTKHFDKYKSDLSEVLLESEIEAVRNDIPRVVNLFS